GAVAAAPCRACGPGSRPKTGIASTSTPRSRTGAGTTTTPASAGAQRSPPQPSPATPGLWQKSHPKPDNADTLRAGDFTRTSYAPGPLPDGARRAGARASPALRSRAGAALPAPTE